MVDKVQVTEKDFSLDEVVDMVRGPRTGAIATFLGTVRADPGVDTLKVEDYRAMALKVLKELREEAIDRFGINDAAIVHRVGDLEVGMNIVAIVVAASHREEAFAACRFLIDELKTRTPIWKMQK